jgi:hypothetical protein
MTPSFPHGAVASGASRRPIPQPNHDVQQKSIDDVQQPPHLSRPPLSLEPAHATRIVRVVVLLPLAHLAVNLPQMLEDMQPAPDDLEQPPTPLTKIIRMGYYR